MRSVTPAETTPDSDSPAASRRAWMAALGSALLLSACATPAPAPAPAPAPSRRPPPPPRTAPQPTERTPLPDARFIRPSTGAILERFDGTRNKGIDYGGKMGDPIIASESGRVVFVGSQLRGYGRVVIVKHDERLISVYAHTSKILVEEKDEVQKGQKIAEMGDSDANRVKLHFEIRRDGTAVNPQPYIDGTQR